jgi:methylglutaconyl-CoA hydratase
MSNTAEGYVRSELRGYIRTIEFYHPQSNALPGQLLQRLAHELHSAGNEEECRVIQLKSAGEKAFCAGAFFDELLAVSNEKEGTKFFMGFAHLINTMRKVPKFIVGRVQGKLVGGGVGLAAACDYVIAMEGAEVKLSELAVGIGPFVVGPAIERKIGLSAFSQMAMDGAMWRTSEWARRNGLFAEVYPNKELMDASIERLTHSLAKSNPEAMAEMKKTFWRGCEDWDQLLAERAAISGRLVMSPFSREALKKALKK